MHECNWSWMFPFYFHLCFYCLHFIVVLSLYLMEVNSMTHFDGNDRLDHKLLSFSHNNNDYDVKKKKKSTTTGILKEKNYENTLVSTLRSNSSICTLQEPCWLWFSWLTCVFLIIIRSKRFQMRLHCVLTCLKGSGSFTPNTLLVNSWSMSNFNSSRCIDLTE